MPTAANSPGSARLPVWETAKEAYALTFSNLGYLFRISWAWMLLWMPIAVYANAAIIGTTAPFADALAGC